MKISIWSFLALTLVSRLALAAPAPGDWQCMVTDGDKKSWVGHGNFERSAVSHALESCKKESNLPATCRSGGDGCDYLVDGVSRLPAWQCTALDDRAQP